MTDAEYIIQLQENCHDWQMQWMSLAKENERLKNYEYIVNFISNDYHELSYEKAQWQRDDWKKRCRKIIDEDTKHDGDSVPGHPDIYDNVIWNEAIEKAASIAQSEGNGVSAKKILELKK